MRSPTRLSLLSLLSLLIALVAITLAACGGTKTVTQTITAPSTSAAASPAPTAALRAVIAPGTAQCNVPAGEGFMGACTARPVQVGPGGTRNPLTAAVGGCKFPDVSSWQGAHVDWPAVAAWQKQQGCHPAGIFKIGEYTVDPDAAVNNAGTAKAGMWRAGYWFVRNTGCSHEAGQIIAEAHALGLKIVVFDAEVPEAHGYLACLAGPVRAAGLVAIGYASPGAFPGGGGGGVYPWIAAYGSLQPASPWGGKLVAWQCSDGVFGCVTNVPGIGRDDVSIDFGITKLGAAPADPFAKAPNTVRYFGKGKNRDHAREHNTLKTAAAHGCHLGAPKREICKSSRRHALLLQHRIYEIATNHGKRKPQWSRDDLGIRYHYFATALAHR